MKKILSLCLLLVVTATVKAQKHHIPFSEFNGDTLRYIAVNFEDNRERYIGHPVSRLLDEWDLPIRSFYPSETTFEPKPEDRDKIKGMDLGYLDIGEGYFYEKAKIPYYSLAVVFEPPYTVPARTVYDIEDAIGNQWGPELYEFYKNFIVKELYVVLIDKFY